MADGCLFCRMVRKEIPVTLVAEDDHCIAFRDINPQAPTHVLVVPRRHVATMDDSTDADLLGRVALMAAEVARREGIADRGYRTVVNTRGDGGQTVAHLHMHLLGGRSMRWPPG